MNWKELLVISAALKTGLLQSVSAKSLSAEELADNFGYDLRAVEIVMEALREIGLVGRDASHYEIRNAAAPFVDENDSNFAANSILHSARLVENWTKIDKAIQSGKSQTRRREPEELEIFLKAMDENSKKVASQVVSILKKERGQTKNALDVGGALGTYTKLFLKEGLKVTLIDTPAVIEVAKKHLGTADVDFVAADFNQWLPDKTFDVILLSNITHIYKPEKLKHLFSQAANILNAEGTIAIVDFVREKSEGAAMFAVNMLIHTAGGGTWTSAQYEKWLRQAGLRLKGIRDLDRAQQKLLLAEKIKQ